MMRTGGEAVVVEGCETYLCICRSRSRTEMYLLGACLRGVSIMFGARASGLKRKLLATSLIN